MARNGEGWARAIAVIAFPGVLLAACAFAPVGSDNGLTSGIGAYRVGEPYQIKGVWYYPAVDYNYDRTGVASWYGEEFEGRLTANGEIFDLNALTAAHTTLPLPSIVQVTNLENGRSLQLRINDRGPFVDGRLIDVSRRAAQLLGFESRGTTLVRVTILRQESIAAAEEAMRSTPVTVAAASGLAPGPLPRSGSVYAEISETARTAHRSTGPLPSRAAVQMAGTVPRRSAIAQTAMARIEPTLPVGRPAMATLEPRVGGTLATRYRFSLISPAEAGELPSFRATARKPERGAPAASGAKMPTLWAKTAAGSKRPPRASLSRPAPSRGEILPKRSSRAFPAGAALR